VFINNYFEREKLSNEKEQFFEDPAYPSQDYYAFVSKNWFEVINSKEDMKETATSSRGRKTAPLRMVGVLKRKKEIPEEVTFPPWWY